MKKIIVKFGKKFFIPTCTLMIMYCIFYQYIEDLPYLYIIKLILLMSFVVQLIGWIIDMGNGSKYECNKQYLIKNSVIKNIYLKANQIITQVFCCYFAVYLVLMLDKKSILYNYLVLFLFGLLLGYKIAIKTYEYLKANQENQNQQQQDLNFWERIRNFFNF